MKKAQAITRYLVLGTLSASLFAGLTPTHASPDSNPPQSLFFAAPSFQSTWARTDRPVALGETQRSYYWGPQANTGGIMEDYNQGVNGKRLVQYFDKSRMEINDPYGNPNDPFFVTNGLLTVELISGRMQIGNTSGSSSYVNRAPADIPLASDTDDPNAPTYISFQGVSDTPLGAHPEGNRVALGMFATKTINKAGQHGDDPTKANLPEAKLAYYEHTTSHNIPLVTWEFLNISGPIYNPALGHNQVSQLSNPWYYATGYPISEPYWAKVKIANVPNVDVMIQAFERRVVTYVPSAPDGFKVQMSNIGQHYYQWRYDTNPPPTVLPAPTETPNPAQPTLVLPHPTVTAVPPHPTATPVNTPVHPASQFEGTWILDERLILLGPDTIVKLRISASGGNLTVHGFVVCDTGMCDVDNKTKQYTGEPFEITLAGVPLRITLTNQGTKFQVVENQTEVLHFHKVTASEFDGVWLNNNDVGDPAKLSVKANGANLTVTRFDACGFDICEKETKTKQFTDEPFTVTLNGDTFKLTVENPGAEANAIKVNINDNRFPTFRKVDAYSFGGTWVSVSPGLKLVISATGNTIHIHSFVGVCIDPTCGPIPDYNDDVQFNGGEPVTFKINSLGYTYKLTIDRAAGTRLQSVRTHAQEAPYTQYLNKTP